MRLAYFCFVTAASAGLGGMSLGIWMGIAHDFTLAPVHAHVNLLGWVTLSLYGLYHRGVDRTESRLAWVQVGAGALGFLMLTGGMAFLIGAGNGAFLPVAIGGSILCVTSMALFIVILLHDALRQRRRRTSSGTTPSRSGSSAPRGAAIRRRTTFGRATLFGRSRHLNGQAIPASSSPLSRHRRSSMSIFIGTQNADTIAPGLLSDGVRRFGPHATSGAAADLIDARAGDDVGAGARAATTSPSSARATTALAPGAASTLEVAGERIDGARARGPDVDRGEPPADEPPAFADACCSDRNPARGDTPHAAKTGAGGESAPRR